jgi:hypothetical protein
MYKPCELAVCINHGHLHRNSQDLVYCLVIRFAPAHALAGGAAATRAAPAGTQSPWWRAGVAGQTFVPLER